MSKRRFIRVCLTLPLLGLFPTLASARFDFGKSRSQYVQRIKEIKKRGLLPIIDVESSYSPSKVDLPSLTEAMDETGIALICLSPSLSKREAKEGRLWSDGALEAYSQFPSHFIPTGNGGNYPAWTEPEYREKFLLENEQRISLDNYPLMGEFEVRHYPSPKEFEEGRTYRDVSIAIDSDDMHKVFSLSSALKVPFQIHYEVEDGLIPPFSEMLRKYPEAKVIWCHFAQIRFSGRAREFNPKRLIGLLTEFPNLYLDLAFGSKNSRYPGSGEYHARFWEDKTGWVSVIEAFPSRILSALDLGGDRMDEIHKKVEVLRSVISELNKSTREWVAYRAAWKLLFDEDLFLEAT